MDKLRGGAVADHGPETGGRHDDGLHKVEERVAHLQRAVDELSDVITRQDAEIRRLVRHVGLLMDREAEREADAGSIPLADQRPPHW